MLCSTSLMTPFVMFLFATSLGGERLFIVHSDSMAWIDPTTGVPGPVWNGGGYGLRSRYFAGWQDVIPLVGRATRVTRCADAAAFPLQSCTVHI